MKTMIKTLAITALTSTVLSTAALAGDITLKFQSSDPAGNPNFILQQGWADLVSEKTGGSVTIELLPVKSIVAHTETQDAIAAGLANERLQELVRISSMMGED